jgi:hypothetical protein
MMGDKQRRELLAWSDRLALGTCCTQQVPICTVWRSVLLLWYAVDAPQAPETEKPT